MGKETLIVTIASIIPGIAFLGTILSMVWITTAEKKRKGAPQESSIYPEKGLLATENVVFPSLPYLTTISKPSLV